jgi:UDP-N-acetylmuramoylalanine--D-glutamate ligase
MKIAILGWGSQGQSSFRYWNHGDNEITVCDKDENISAPEVAATQLGEGYLKDLVRFDMLIRTPALHPNEIVESNANNSQILDKVWTNTNEFFKVCPTKNIIGVTGTKGKGTTSTLIAKMLEAAGKRVHLGGNIGTPPLDLLKDDISSTDWVVLELANFQLIDLKTSPHIAVCLMVEPEHMDWHEDFEEYIAAKQQMFINQAADDIAVYYSRNENSRSIADASGGILIPYFEAPGALVEDDTITIGGTAICKTNELKLLGKHNRQNVCAAVTAVWQVTQDVNTMKSVLTSFTGLEHRLEFVREVDGIRYYDDSFGTTPETAIVAIEAFSQPKIVILGGSDKGAAYEKLAQTVVSNNVRHAVLIGDTGPAIGKALKSAGFSNVSKGGDSMQAIVETARNAAEEGDVVLLSTACASFGLFKNYKHRGEEFQKAVKALEEPA